MKNNKLFVIIILIAAVAGYAGISSYMKSSESRQAENTPAVSAADLIKDHSPTLGPKDAKVQLVEFLDPECEACRAMDPIVKGLLNQYEGKILFVVRYMPFHQNSTLAAAALEEAKEQGKYWQALSNLFYNQPQWGDHANPRPELITKFLSDIGVKFSTTKPEELIAKHEWKVQQDFADGKKLGVNGTPTFFINGRKLQELGYEPLKAAIDKELAK